MTRRHHHFRYSLTVTNERFYISSGEAEFFKAGGAFEILTGANQHRTYDQGYVQLTYWYLQLHSYVTWLTVCVCYVPTRIGYYSIQNMIEDESRYLWEQWQFFINMDANKSRTAMKWWQYFARLKSSVKKFITFSKGKLLCKFGPYTHAWSCACHFNECWCAQNRCLLRQTRLKWEFLRGCNTTKRFIKDFYKINKPRNEYLSYEK